VGSKWIIKIKRHIDSSINKFKACLITRGFILHPRFDFDETYTPIIRFDSLRLVLALSAINDWRFQ
jgi:hypothetical protein